MEDWQYVCKKCHILVQRDLADEKGGHQKILQGWTRDNTKNVWCDYMGRILRVKNYIANLALTAYRLLWQGADYFGVDMYNERMTDWVKRCTEYEVAGYVNTGRRMVLTLLILSSLYWLPPLENSLELPFAYVQKIKSANDDGDVVGSGSKFRVN